MAGNGGGLSVTGKVAAILNSFAADREELSLTELCRRTGLPSSTAHRLAAELLAQGILERSAAGGYLIGVRLWEISARSPRSSGLRDIAMPFLQDLYGATEQHVQLAVLDGDDALIVEKISGRRAVPTIGRAGGRLPLHASGVGKAILAHAGSEVQERILAGPLRRFTPATITGAPELRAALAQIRREQTAYCHEELTAGAVSCAAPVLSRDPPIVGAVSVIVTAETDVTMLAAAVRTAANGVARELRATNGKGVSGCRQTGSRSASSLRTGRYGVMPGTGSASPPSGIRPRAG
jgi:DNA-binding IclR family transcriptional regulator